MLMVSFLSAGYELERMDRPGVSVDLSSTLESQRTLDFVLVKNQGKVCSHSALISSPTVAVLNANFFLMFSSIAAGGGFRIKLLLPSM